MEKETYYLVTYRGNWADEFDVEGFWILDKKDCDELESKIHKYFEKNGNFSFYFGTNQEIEYESEEQFLDDVSFEEISKTKYRNKVLDSFGITPFDRFYDDEDGE